MVEDPTYVGLLDVAAGLGLRLVALPEGPGGGPDPEQVARVCRSRRVRVVVVLPAVHSPTGRRLRVRHRQSLAAALDGGRGLVVVEDNTLADLAFSGGRPPSLALLCARVYR